MGRQEKEIDKEILKNLDLLMSLEVIEEEENWEAADDQRSGPEGQFDD
jgi:hypothetical protein